MRSVQRFGGALCLTTLLACVSITHAARAQNAAGSTAKVAAETLFEEGRRLMAEGKAVEACPKFAESQRLDPSPGTLLNLASCYEKSDRPATAWATYREGASVSAATGRQDLLATAQRHAEALLPTLPRVTVKVASAVDGLTVALDGVAVGHAEWGIAVPVDPGEHTVDASAPRYKSWSTKVMIGKEPTTTAIAVPTLELAPEPVPNILPPATVPPATQPSDAVPVPPAAEPASSGGTQRAVGIVVGAAGIVALGVGAGFAANAKSTYNSSLSNCETSNPNLCNPAGLGDRNNALTAGNVATGLVIGGGALLAAGIVVFFTAPHGPKRPPQAASLSFVPLLGAGVGGGALQGTW